MKPKKIIAVVGATSAQGRGVVDAIFNDPSGEITARAITRDLKSEKARGLAAKKMEVVRADISDQESLVNALKGAFGTDDLGNMY